MYRVIVAGSRNYTDYKRVSKELRAFFTKKHIGKFEVEIISGTASGADSLGERFAREYNLKLTKFPAKWDELGKAAGPIRNEEMAKYASEENGVLFAFWDGVSTGTKSMIDLGRKYKLDNNIFVEEKSACTT